MPVGACQPRSRAVVYWRQLIAEEEDSLAPKEEGHESPTISVGTRPSFYMPSSAARANKVIGIVVELPLLYNHHSCSYSRIHRR